jgi:hypothetical protein
MRKRPTLRGFIACCSALEANSGMHWRDRTTNQTRVSIPDLGALADEHLHSRETIYIERFFVAQAVLPLYNGPGASAGVVGLNPNNRSVDRVPELCASDIFPFGACPFLPSEKATHSGQVEHSCPKQRHRDCRKPPRSGCQRVRRT